MPAGLQVRAPGNRRSRVQFAPRKRSSVKMSCQSSRQTQTPRRMPKGLQRTKRENLWGSSPHLAGGQRCGRGSHSLFFLVAPFLMEGSSVGRAAGFGPDDRGFEPFPSSQEQPGECRAEYSLETCLPRPLSPRPETPRRMPCGTTAKNARGRRFKSRHAPIRM